jgi:hypothetical protein
VDSRLRGNDNGERLPRRVAPRNDDGMMRDFLPFVIDNPFVRPIFRLSLNQKKGMPL